MRASKLIVLLACLATVVAFGVRKEEEDRLAALQEEETEEVDMAAGYLQEAENEEMNVTNNLRGPFDFALEDSCSSVTTCTAKGVVGVCVNVNAGCCLSGTITGGVCSGASYIKCCTEPTCITPKGTGTCLSSCPSGTSGVSGYCHGPSSITCCVPNASPTQKPATKPVSVPTQKPATKPVPAPVPAPTKPVAPTKTNKPVAPIPPTAKPVAPVAPKTNKPVAPSASTDGTDFSSLLSTSQMSCFANTKNYNFVIPRGYRSSGQVDTNVCKNIITAANAGIQYRDAYMFPCPKCSKSAATQVNELVSFIKANCASQFSGRLWLDVEQSSYWLGSSSSNKQWYQSFVDACTASGYNCGVYSSKSQWTEVFGSSTYSYGSNLPLWYAHYDSLPTFSDYKQFGGWTTPFAKQYLGDVTMCEVVLDVNYCPSYRG